MINAKVKAKAQLELKSFGSYHKKVKSISVLKNHHQLQISYSRYL